MVGSVADINIELSGNIYRLKDLYGKTLYAAKKIAWFKSYLSPKASGTIEKNEVVGIVQGFVQKGYKGAKQSFFIVGPSSNTTKVVPYTPNNFADDKLIEQGLKNVKDQAASDQSDLAPWYTKVIKQAGPWIIVGIIAYTFVKKKL